MNKQIKLKKRLSNVRIKSIGNFEKSFFKSRTAHQKNLMVKILYAMTVQNLHIHIHRKGVFVTIFEFVFYVIKYFTYKQYIQRRTLKEIYYVQIIYNIMRQLKFI